MPSPGGIVYLAGLIFAEALRLPQGSHRTTGQDRQQPRIKPVQRLEWLVLLGILGGIWALPLLYIFTGQPAALSYRLPPWSVWPATFVFAVSLVIRWQAHRALGRQWSHTLRTASDHILVTDGIYHYVRHPIYVSLVLWAAAQPILLPNWLAGWSGAVAVALIWLIRVPREEQMMLDRFGPAYRDYMVRTGRMLPRRIPIIDERGNMMKPFELQRDGYTISTDKARLDISAIHEYLSERSYWAEGRPREVVERAIENSLCFGVYEGERQAGFARVVTDYATLAWLCDVFVLEDYRGRGLGKWLVETINAHPSLAALRRIYLATYDAHELYRRYGGFEALPGPEYWMVRSRET